VTLSLGRRLWPLSKKSASLLTSAFQC